MTGGIEVVGGGIVALGAVGAATAWRVRGGARELTPWRLVHQGSAFAATNQTSHHVLDVRVRVDGADVRGDILGEQLTAAPREAITFSAEPGLSPTVDPGAQAVDAKRARELPSVEISWKYEVGGRRYYWSTSNDDTRPYYWSRGPGGSWG